MTTYENFPGTETALGLWRTLFGDEEGYLCVASGERVEGANRLENFAERFFRYPEQVEEAAAYVLEADEAVQEVYFCTHLLTAARRTKDNAAPLSALVPSLPPSSSPSQMPSHTVTAV